MKLHKIDFTNDNGKLIEVYRSYDRMPFQIIADGHQTGLDEAEIAEAIALFNSIESGQARTAISKTKEQS